MKYYHGQGWKELLRVKVVQMKTLPGSRCTVENVTRIKCAQVKILQWSWLFRWHFYQGFLDWRLCNYTVYSINVTCIAMEMLSLSLSISCRFFVPKMFLSEVWARSLKCKKYIWCWVMMWFLIPGGVVSILHICHTDNCIGHSVVHHCIYWHCHGVLR